jgi:hypothetical protein
MRRVPAAAGMQQRLRRVPEVVSDPRITPEGKAQADSEAEHTR